MKNNKYKLVKSSVPFYDNVKFKDLELLSRQDLIKLLVCYILNLKKFSKKILAYKLEINYLSRKLSKYEDKYNER